MILSRLSSVPLSAEKLVLRSVAIRLASHGVAPARPKPAKIQLQKPPGVEGYLKYERNFSRDSTFTDPPVKNDVFMRFVKNKMGFELEMYPVTFLIGLWHIVFFVTVVWSFCKIEIWLDRSHRDPPWDWSRCRDNYWKQSTVIFDPDGRTHRRLPVEYEKLQDEMIEAAKQRGTR